MLQAEILARPDGFYLAALQSKHLVSPAHPHAAIQSSLDLNTSTTHAASSLLPSDAVDHAVPAHSVILAHGAAEANAQHRIQIDVGRQRAMGIASHARFAIKSSVPKWNVDLLQISVGAVQIMGSHLAQPFHQAILRGLE